jgi:predicted ester cyclase
VIKFALSQIEDWVVGPLFGRRRWVERRSAPCAGRLCDGAPFWCVHGALSGLVDGGAATFEPDEVVPEIAALRSSFPDLRFAVEESFSAGNRHVLRMRATGTHTGEAFLTEIGTAAAAGQPIAFQGFEVFEIRDDRVVDVWIGWNFGALYAALGARF